MESLGFLVADLLPLPVSQAEAILATTNAVERFQLLLSFLEPVKMKRERKIVRKVVVWGDGKGERERDCV
jgi:hypothetical protein